MKIQDLSKQQLLELKERYYTERNENVSFGELANIDILVTDEEIFNEYDGIEFTSEDFFCSVEKEKKNENTVYIVIQTGMNDYREDMPTVQMITRDYEKAKKELKRLAKEIETDVADCLNMEDISINKELENGLFEIWYTEDTCYYSTNVYIIEKELEK